MHSWGPPPPYVSLKFHLPHSFSSDDGAALSRTNFIELLVFFDVCHNRRLARFTDSLTISIKFVDNSFFFFEASQPFEGPWDSSSITTFSIFSIFSVLYSFFSWKTLFVVIFLAHRWWLFDRCKKIILRLLDRSTHWSLLTLDMEQLTFNKIDSTYVSIINRC